jgi:ketosteroid isomerase-like protein
MAVYAPGDLVVAFDIVPPLAKVGSKAYRQNYEEFFGMFKGPLRVELRDVRIVAGDDVAFLHCFDRMSGTLQGGEEFDLWLRVTSGLRRIDGQWRIIHDHVSVPTNFETGTAALDLTP